MILQDSGRLTQYTRVYNALESSTASSVDSLALRGISKAGKLLGSAVAKTPVGEHTLIDEALQGGGKAIGSFNRGKNERLLKKLHAAKSPDVLPFQENAKAVAALYNEPSQLLTDGESFYVLPAVQEADEE